MEKIPPEEIAQLLQNFQKQTMINFHRDLDIFYTKDIERSEKFLKNSNAKEEDWEMLQVFKDFHKDQREAYKKLTSTSYFADMPPLKLEEGLTQEELVRGLKGYKKLMMDRADREEKMYEKKATRMFAKVREECIKDEIFQFAGVQEPAKAKVLRWIKELKQECEADETENTST